MNMISIIVIGILCLTCVNGTYIAIENATHFTNDSFYKPDVLEIKNQLVYVSYQKVNADVIVKLESSAIPKKKNHICEIKIPVPSDRNFVSPKSKFLGNKKLVMAIVETQLHNAEEDTDPYIRFYVVDLFDDCSYKNFTVLFDNLILLSYKPFVIIPYQKTFNLFVKSKLHCEQPGSICMISFTEEGDLLEVENFDFNTKTNSFDLVKIYPLKEYDPLAGYVFLSYHTSTLKTLDSRLRTIKELKFNHIIYTQSVLDNDIGVCYHGESFEAEVVCLKLDSRLKTKTRVTLNNQYYLVTRKMYNLANGDSLILIISGDKNINVFVKRLTLGGRLSRPKEYTFECQSFRTLPESSFVELKNDIYCLSFQCNRGMITHCMKPTEAKNLWLFV